MSIEQTYKKFTQIEHVLARPGMYIGDIATVHSSQWILDSNNDRIISVVQSALSNEAFMTSTDFGASTKREELFTLLRTVTGGTGTYIPPDEDRGR